MSGDDAHRVHVRWVNRDGVRGEVTLPADVDPETADLGTSERGLFVSWRDGGTVRIAPVAAAGTTASRSAGMIPTGTTAIGAGDRCVAGWTNRDGREAHVLVAPSCP